MDDKVSIWCICKRLKQGKGYVLMPLSPPFEATEAQAVETLEAEEILEASRKPNIFLYLMTPWVTE